MDPDRRGQKDREIQDPDEREAELEPLSPEIGQPVPRPDDDENEEPERADTTPPAGS